MTISKSGMGSRLWNFIAGVHIAVFLVEVVIVIAATVTYYVFGPHTRNPFSPPSSESRGLLTLVLGVSLIVLFRVLVALYKKIIKKDAGPLSFSVSDLALGLLRGWADDKQTSLKQPHKVLIVGDSTVVEDSKDACKDISGPGLEPLVFDVANKDRWQTESSAASAIYLFRTKDIVDTKWIHDAILELSKTTSVHSPVVEADLYPENPGGQVFYRIQKDAFPKKVNILLLRAIERAALLSAQAAFNRFALFGMIVLAVAVVFALGSPLFHRSINGIQDTTDLVNSQNLVRMRLEACFPFDARQALNPADCDLENIKFTTRNSIHMALLHPRIESPVIQEFRTKPRLTVWRSARYKNHEIVFVAGSSGDLKTHVFMNVQPQGGGSADRDSIIAGAISIRGWVLWRKKCPVLNSTAAWRTDGSEAGSCLQPDGKVTTEEPRSIIKWGKEESIVDLTALLCYGDAHGDGACIGVTEGEKLLEDRALRQDVASWTTLIAGRPTSLLFGSDVKKTADEVIAGYDAKANAPRAQE